MKRNLSTTSVCLITLGATILFATLTDGMAGAGNGRLSFLLLWPALLISAYFGGWRQAVISLLLGAGMVAAFHPEMRDGRTRQEWEAVILYLLCGAGFVWFCRAQQPADAETNYGKESITTRFSGPKLLLATAVAALLLVWANSYLYPLLGKVIPFTVFYPLMALVGFIGGARPVIVVLVIGLVSVSIWQNDLGGTPNNPAFNVLRGVFAFIGLTYALFSDAMVRERARAAAGTAALRDLPEAEARLAAIAQTSPDVLWILDVNTGRVIFINQAIEKVTGHTMAEAYARTREEAWEAIYPDDVPIVNAAMEALNTLETGRIVEYEYRQRHKDGRWIWQRNRAGVFSRNSDGTVSNIFGHSEDITDRRGAAERLAAQSAELERIAAEREVTIRERETLLEAERAARAEAERANRLKDDFLATVSHELRTPLTAILGWTTLLGEDAQDPELRQGLEVISRNARAQRQLIEDLLDMSRIMTGKLRIELRQILLKDVIGTAIETIAPAAAARGVKLVSHTENCDGPIFADQDRLQQIIWNLLSNAVKFTTEGGQVEVLAVCSPDEATISVSDTGQGIAPEFIPHVFERFRQEDGATTRKAGGLGLGLAIVKHLVELHGGTISVQSKGLGQGSTFTFNLPLRTEPVPASQETENRLPVAPLEEGRDGKALRGRKILIVDDEEDTRTYLHRVLSDRGALVSSAQSAAEGLRLTLADPPEAVICDISMPGEDGYGFIRQFRLIEDMAIRSIPVAALTALARSEDQSRALEAGFNEHCSKPVEPAELIALVSRMLPEVSCEAQEVLEGIAPGRIGG